MSEETSVGVFRRVLCLLGFHNDRRVDTQRFDYYGPPYDMLNVPVPVFQCRGCGRRYADGPVPVDEVSA